MQKSPKLKLNKHYMIHGGVYIHRKIFLCRECSGLCKPSNYERLHGHQFYMIARSYTCKPCDLRIDFPSIIGEVLE